MLVNKYNYLHRITPQMRKVVDRVETWKKSNPMRGSWDCLEGIQEYRDWYAEERAWWNEGGPQMEKTEDIWIPGGPNGQVNVRLHYPTVTENMPILVYSHGGGDVCGNNDTHSRIMRILAEKTGCCVIGVNYKLSPEARFPSQIEEVILSVEELGPHYEIILEREGYLDKLTIKVELAQSTDSFKMLEKITAEVKNKLKIILGLDAKVLLESPNTLQRFEGKAKRVKDLRNNA